MVVRALNSSSREAEEEAGGAELGASLVYIVPGSQSYTVRCWGKGVGGERKERRK